MLEIVERHTDARIDLKGNRTHIVYQTVLASMIIVVVGGGKDAYLIAVCAKLVDQIDHRGYHAVDGWQIEIRGDQYPPYGGRASVRRKMGFPSMLFQNMLHIA